MIPALLPTLAAFVAIVGLADLQGWGHPGEYGGLLALLALVYFSSWLSPRGWRRVWLVMLLVSVAVCGIALWQWHLMARPHGPFRSANFLGAYAVLHLCIAILWRSPLPAAANLVSLALSQSRGAALAAIAAALILGWQYHRRLAAAAALVLLLAVSLWTMQRGLDEPRLGLWRIALQAGLQRPLLGWGQGGLVIAGVGQFYNQPLEWFVAAGLCGLAAGLAVGLAALRAVQCFAGEAERLALLAFLAAWLVSGLFLFSGPPSALSLALVLGWLVSEQRRVEDVTAAVDYYQPFLDRGVAADRTD